MILKRLGGVSFGLAFIMGIVIFGGIGQSIIPVSTARILFIAFGALGVTFNLLGFQTGKHSPLYSLFYWLATVIILFGLISKMMHWPGATLSLLFGILMMGVSFFIPSKRNDLDESAEDLLDQ